MVDATGLEPVTSSMSRKRSNQLSYASHWRRGAELNRCIRVLQTPALPLGYRARPNHSTVPLRRTIFLPLFL